MINQVEAKPGLGMTYDTSLSPAPAPESQGESVAAPAEVGQVGGTKSKVFFGVDCSKEANLAVLGLLFFFFIDGLFDVLDFLIPAVICFAVGASLALLVYHAMGFTA